ncbi:E3 ubiquitin-protein ligase SSM4 [Aspergillus brunneoviolaceus CBS 621.78]|uniref:RING finger membrane protein n=1 Tax=Aspergillus brunneoviolaceus CBS 621.78 TaxID=1450534 RepID=A0ACD1GL95_9EURO|nr:RING finger membrane protein [Aspergillus brunneoviolaceus CBS 621.78]RAH50064.1 RING finger membrane protein [Aspergillus brunneoviolaceus CBS 621.78]
MGFANDNPRDYAGSAPFPDLMNDPAYDTNHKGKEREFDEPDTCRICRGEGTPEEPLFYPCKCSGSIKFVHQACLVEWLSHSQKKHCELCKTPFRFTKLYDPNMPQSLPAPLFFKQIMIHSFRTVVTWLRFILVAFVWLGWLPWSMRAIWRALFWLADGRWTGADNNHQPGIDFVVANGTTTTIIQAATGLPRSTTSQPSTADVPSVQSPVSSMFGFASGEPLLFTLIKKAFSVLFSPAMSVTGSIGANSNMTTATYNPRRPSWLSDVKFLNTLTPSPTINNIIIDTLEGQLITLLVVISFILIFLIREWVVQQQPMANIAEGEREAAVQLIANNLQNQPVENAEPAEDAALPPQDAELDAEDHEPAGDDFHRAFNMPASPAVDLDQFPRSSPLDPESRSGFESSESQGFEPLRSFQNTGESDGEAELDFPSEQPYAQTWPGVDTFRDLWDRGHGDPEQVLRIVRDEGRQNDLDWIVNAVSKIQRNEDRQDQWRRDPPLEASSSTHFDAGMTQPEGASAPEQLDDDRALLSTSTRPWSFAEAVQGNADIDRLERHPDSDGFRSSSYHATEREPPQEPTPSSNDAPQMGDQTSAAIPNQADPANDHEQSSNHPSTTEAARPIENHHKSFVACLLDWFWADVGTDDQGQDQGQAHDDDEQVVVDPELEAPFVPIQNDRRLAEGGAQDNQGLMQDPGVDGNDLDAVEDGDDLEGILELIGMQGPIFGLLQNGVFSALLISFTVAIGIWLPYLWGKIALVLLANPVHLIVGVPMTAISVFADVALDTLIGSLGYLMYWGSLICKTLLGPFIAFAPVADWIPETKSVTSASLSLIDASSSRLRNALQSFFVFHESDVPMFSVLSHHALKIHQARISYFVETVFFVGKFILHDFPLRLLNDGLPGALSFGRETIDFTGLMIQARDQIYSLGNQILYTSNGTNVFMAGLNGTSPNGINISQELAVWDTKDRVIAILLGYVLASVVGLLYLRVTNLLSGAERRQRVEGLIADVIHQGGGVMKVILIIGIEMIVFPLYCGSLLDVALLPLFENATIASRLEFTASSPLTSLFVHWFIGTCYMFHFALFVSMCRKIMRSGVLYFIRDPDDPTFHPVRDVLERNITTQLRKIAFSALVYGALVVICLGGVVWGMYYGLDGVLPIHWSATVPVLEFPVDLLFYNFVMPFAIRSLKPSDGLHGLYDWWFHKCARFLRLTNFFFGDRQPDEEGRHVGRSWWALFSAAEPNAENSTASGTQAADTDEKFDSASIVRDGRFVRAPASDQVRIPKGNKVFVEVTENNERLDGVPDTDQGLHGRANEMFTKVYVPPNFRTRIAAFILLIWVFAAATGVGITVLPLIIGRKIMNSSFPHRPMNDIYAFSTGLSIVGTAAYIGFYSRTFFDMAKERLGVYLQSPQQVFLGIKNALHDVIRLLYVFIAFAVVLPSAFALIMELYILVPVHTYLGGPEAHVIHFIQDWTLGVLYVQMAVKFVLWNSRSRQAAALIATFRDGWLKPNAKIATRGVLLPVTLLTVIAVLVPLSMGFALNSTIFYNTPEVQFKVYRYAYPVTLTLSLIAWLVYLVRRQVEIWRVNIRDDVYLIGERLHNFRDKRARDVGGVPRRVITG